MEVSTVHAPAGQAATALSELVTRCFANDQEAWSELVGRFTPLMNGVLRSYRFQDYEREDVCQAAWTNVFRHLDQLKDANRLPRWLIVLTRNEALRHARKDGWSTPVGDISYFETEPDDSVESIVTDRLYLQEVASVVRQLPIAEQRLLELLMGEPPRLYTEISALLGIPRGSIGPVRARILARLRRRLLSQGLYRS